MAEVEFAFFSLEMRETQDKWGCTQGLGLPSAATWQPPDASVE